VPTTPPAGPTTVPGDLVLWLPMARPPCDGSYIVMVGAAVTPGLYASAISDILVRFPGSGYLRTDQTCASLRASSGGNPIYSVFYGPYATAGEACSTRDQIGGDSYVKVLDGFSDPSAAVRC
jgi:serine/threonine-protein kinase